jgi:hypothetical protein
MPDIEIKKKLLKLWLKYRASVTETFYFGAKRVTFYCYTTQGKKDKLDWSRRKNGGQWNAQEGDERIFIPREKEVDPRLDG